MSLLKKVLIRFGLIPSQSHKLQDYLDSLNIPTRNHNTQVDGLTPSLIQIGENFVSAPGSKIVSHDSSLVLSQGVLRFGKVKIGDNVFVGANSVILPGTEIGNNCIVGAGAVVKGKFDAHSVIVGNPAKSIMTVEQLLTRMKEGDGYIKIPDHLLVKFKKSKLSFDDKRELESLVNGKILKG